MDRDDLIEKAAWVIWETSRADESTISATGAKIVATALANAGLLQRAHWWSLPDQVAALKIAETAANERYELTRTVQRVRDLCESIEPATPSDRLPWDHKQAGERALAQQVLSVLDSESES